MPCICTSHVDAVNSRAFRVDNDNTQGCDTDSHTKKKKLYTSTKLIEIQILYQPFSKFLPWRNP
jgi:hypothetical protein